MNYLQRKILDGMFIAKNSDTGINATAVTVAYQAFFTRYNRPDYSLKCGEYCYDRVRSTLPRSEFYFKVKGTKLKGYYYESKAKRGIIIVSHGLKAGADDYIPLIKYVVKHGFDVFAYDVTGTYDSEGDNTVGMCQAIIDLEGAIKYVQSSHMFGNLPIFLIGHSWGAYAVASVLSLCKGISGCAAISGMNNGCNMMVDKATQYVGKIGAVPGPLFEEYQRMLFGDYVNCNAVAGINSKPIPVLIAHGVTDKTITYNTQSIVAHKEEITNKKVQYYIGKGIHGGHDDIWHSKEAYIYQREVESDIKLLTFEKGRDLTDKEKQDYYKHVNHELYSAPNEELLDKIIAMFESARKN